MPTECGQQYNQIPWGYWQSTHSSFVYDVLPRRRRGVWTADCAPDTFVNINLIIFIFKICLMFILN